MESDSLSALLGDVEEASKVPARQRQPIRPTVVKLTSLLYSSGALPDEVDRLVELMVKPNHLDQASLGAMVGNLYPAVKVTSTVVLKVVGALGHGQLKPSLTLQAHLLRWLVMVHHVLEDPALLSRAYAVLFNLLDTAAVRGPLCQLLALVTRRKHVSPYRIQSLLQLVRQTGGDASLVGLLRVFKNYYPEVVLGETRGRVATVKPADVQWHARLLEIQRERKLADKPRAEETEQKAFSVLRTADGRGKGPLPGVQTLHAQENSVTLEEVHKAEVLVGQLEKIELPNQLVAVLADPLLQKLMLLKPDGESRRRVSNWLLAFLEDVASRDADQSLLVHMAQVVHDYAKSTKILSPDLIGFLQHLLSVWDGRQGRESVIGCLTFVPPMDFDEAYASTFQPLERAILDGTCDSQRQLVVFYTNLLRRWQVALRSVTDVSAAQAKAVPGLVRHFNRLALTVTVTAPTTASLVSVMDFYDLDVSDGALLGHWGIIMPPPLLVYGLFFSASLAVVSRLCGVLATYKTALGATMDMAEKASVKTFNGFLMDMCNCLVRTRAFSTDDVNAQGCRLAPQVRHALALYAARVDKDFALEAMLSLSYSPLLSWQAISYVRDLEVLELEEPAGGELRARHAGPVTQSSLVQLGKRGGLAMSWQEYRSGVLEYLEAKGMVGIPDLIYNTIKTLRKTT